MGALSGTELLKATALPRERLELPELGEGQYVIVQGMSGKQRDAFEISLRKGRNGERRNLENVRARLAAECLINEDGTRMIPADQVQALGDIRVDVLLKIVAVAQRLSALSEEDAEELGKPSDGPTASVGSSSN